MADEKTKLAAIRFMQAALSLGRDRFAASTVYMRMGYVPADSELSGMVHLRHLRLVTGDAENLEIRDRQCCLEWLRFESRGLAKPDRLHLRVSPELIARIHGAAGGPSGIPVFVREAINEKLDREASA